MKYYIDNIEYFQGWPNYGYYEVETNRSPEDALRLFLLCRPNATANRVLFKNEIGEFEEIEVQLPDKF